MDTKLMRTPVFVGQGEIEWSQKSVPEPKSGQLLIEVKANALCGSERPQFYEGSSVIPGHEASGIVIAAGSETQTKVGTPGVVYLMEFCGGCRNCKKGFTNQCLKKRGDMGFNKDGGYAPYMLVHENIFFPIDHDIPLIEATMLLDIMGTGGHAIKRAKLVHPDIQSLLIAGAGPIGLGVLAMAKILFGDSFPVFIMDYIPYRLNLAEELGGNPIPLNESSLEGELEKYGMCTVDVAIDTSGKASARQASMQVLSQRGILVCVGHGESLNLDVSKDLISTERAVLGSEYFKMEELAGNIPLFKKHLPYLRQVITHRFGVEELQSAYELFFGGQTGKVVIEQ